MNADGKQRDHWHASQRFKTRASVLDCVCCCTAFWRFHMDNWAAIIAKLTPPKGPDGRLGETGPPWGVPGRARLSERAAAFCKTMTTGLGDSDSLRTETMKTGLDHSVHARNTIMNARAISARTWRWWSPGSAGWQPAVSQVDNLRAAGRPHTRSAGCQPATRQTASLRYVGGGPAARGPFASIGG